MNQLAPINTGNAVAKRLVEMDELERQAHEAVFKTSRIFNLERAEYYDSRAAAEALTELEGMALNGLRSILDDIESGLGVASEKLIRQQVAFLLGSFPASHAPDPQVYVRAMVAEVIAAAPSEHALDTACRRLRRTAKWPPSIADILAETKAAEREWSWRRDAILELPDRRAAAIKKITADRDKLAGCENTKSTAGTGTATCILSPIS